MPFPASMKAMRAHYNPDWHRPEPDGELRAYRVKVEYSYRESEEVTYDVEAVSEEDAERVALELFGKDGTIDGEMIDVDNVIVKATDQ
jgi:hypothetical protein